MTRLLSIATLILIILSAGLTANASRFLKIALKTGDEEIIRLSEGVAITFIDNDHTNFQSMDGEYIAENSDIAKVEHLQVEPSDVSAIPAAYASITLEGSTLRVSGITNVALYSSDGKPMASLTSGSNIDMSALPHGVYILATPLGTYKIKW